MPEYKIQMLEVGYVDGFPADFAFDGAYKSGELLYNPFCFTLLSSGERNILIDCGINLKAPARREFFNCVPGTNGHGADEVLKTAGLTPDDIDSIIITHCHWDHLSGLVYFPSSKIYIQRDEYERWRETLSIPGYDRIFAMQMVSEDLDTIAAAHSEGRVTFLDGDVDGLFPGIDIRLGEFGHSFAQQIVLISTGGVRYVAVGDICNRPENLLGSDDSPGYIPNVKFAVGSVLGTLRDYDRIMSWAGGDISRVLMTHDGTRTERYTFKKSALGLNIFDIN